jgi:hypothetical protein
VLVEEQAAVGGVLDERGDHVGADATVLGR